MTQKQLSWSDIEQTKMNATLLQIIEWGVWQKTPKHKQPNGNQRAELEKLILRIGLIEYIKSLIDCGVDIDKIIVSEYSLRGIILGSQDYRLTKLIPPLKAITEKSSIAA